MIEKVARAISASFREEGGFWDGEWSDETEHAAFLASARAAIEAMREPTEAMKNAGSEALPFDVEISCDAEPSYKAMIEAALNATNPAPIK